MFQKPNIKMNSTFLFTLPLLHNFFKKIILMHSKNFHTSPKSLGVHPFFLKDYQIAARNYSLEKSIKIIHLLKDADLKSKGINNNRVNIKELMLDLILDIIRI